MTDKELLEQALKLVSKYHARETVLVDWQTSIIEDIKARLSEDDEVPVYTGVGYDGKTFHWYRRPQPKARLTDEDMQKAAQAAERERIKCRVKEAAENLWCIRNEVVEEIDGELKRVPYSLYIGPSLNTLEQFVEKLMEE